MSILNLTSARLSISNTPTVRSHNGIKIIDSNPNKRVSDIFFVNKQTFYENSASNKQNKSRIIEITEKLIDDKLRSSTPYMNGQRNIDFNPINHNSSIDMTLDKRIYNKPKVENNRRKSEGNTNTAYDDQNNIKINRKDNKYNDKTEFTKFKTINPSSSSIPNEYTSNILSQNEKNKKFTENKKNLKLIKQEEMTRNATLSLISKQNSKKDILYKKFQVSKHLFDTENRKDYVLERARKNYTKNNNLNDDKNKNYIINEQRHEVVDYYEMNQKIIDSKTKSNNNLQDSERFFTDVKKISNMLVKTDKIKKEEDKTKDIQGRSTRISMNMSGLKKKLNISSISSNVKTPRPVSSRRSGSDIKQKLDFTKVNKPKIPYK